MPIPEYVFDVVNGPVLTLISGSVSASIYLTDHSTIGFGSPGSPSVDTASRATIANTSSYVSGGLAIVGTLTASQASVGILSASSIYTDIFDATVTTMSVGYLTVTQTINGTAKSASYVPASAVDVFATTQTGTGVGGLIFSEHFIAATTALISNLAVTVTGKSAAGNMVSGSVGHPGVIRLTTGTTATGRAALNALANAILFGSGTYSVETLIYIPTLSTSTQRYTLYFGFGDNSGSGDQADGAYFQYTDSASTFWQIKTAAASVRTTTTTTVSVTTGWNKFRVVAVGTASANFYINDVLVGTIATNIPSGLGKETSLILKIEKSVGTTASYILSDFIKFAFV